MKSLSIVLVSYECVSIKKTHIPCAKVIQFLVRVWWDRTMPVPAARHYITRKHKFILLCVFNNNIRAESMEFNCHFSGQIFQCDCMRSHVTRTGQLYCNHTVCPEAKWPLWIFFYNNVPFNLTMHGLTSNNTTESSISQYRRQNLKTVNHFFARMRPLFV